MKQDLREIILRELSADSCALNDLHERTGGIDSRKLLAELHVLAGHRLVSCERQDGRLLWEITEKGEEALERGDVPAQAAALPPTPTQPAPPPERRNQAGVPMQERTAHSVRTLVLNYVINLERMERSGAIADALKLPPKQVHNQLSLLSQGGKIERIGHRGSAVYGPKGMRMLAGHEPQPETVRAIERIGEAVQTKPAPSSDPVDSPAVNSETVARPVRQPARLITLQVKVPIDKVGAVARAIEQALA
jgi:hypothetical protein